jgi:hypothetical protein
MSETAVLTPREVSQAINQGDDALTELLTPFVPKGGNIGGFRNAVVRYVRYLDSVDAATRTELADSTLAIAASKAASSPKRKSPAKK